MASWLSLLPILLLAPVSGAQRVPVESPQTRPDSTSLSALFEHAKRHEIDAVLRLGQDPVHAGDRAWEIGYPVALYIASPQKYQRGFVDHFPVDAEGIMQILYEKIEVPKLTPKWLFSFESLGSIARSDLSSRSSWVEGQVEKHPVNGSRCSAVSANSACWNFPLWLSKIFSSEAQ